MPGQHVLRTGQLCNVWRVHLPHSVAMLCCVVLRNAGKTHVGLRLAQLYGLLHVNTTTIMAELQHMDPETQKV